MDYYLDSFENVAHAIKFSRHLISLLKLGGFNLTKFVSNADKITSAMNPEDCEASSSPIKEICNGTEQASHVLGLISGTMRRTHWLLAEAWIVLSIKQKPNEPS